MNWKNWPYWIKGGAIVFLILSVLSVMFGIGPRYCKSGEVCGDQTVPNLLGQLILPLERFLDLIQSLFAKVLLIGIYYFVIGTLLGWLYGKFKNLRVPNS